MKILIFCKIFFFSFYALAADEGRFIYYKSLPPQALQKVDAVRLIITDNRIKKTKGTAFFITPNILVTAYHVIKEWKDLSPENGPSDLFIFGAKGHFRFKRIAGFLEEHDLALIEVENTAADSTAAPFLTLSYKPIQKGDLVYTFGYAGGILTTIESEVVDLNEGFSLYKGADIMLEFEITKPSGKDTAGMSGSPVINNKGEVVGVYLRGLVINNPKLFESEVELNRAYITSVAHLEELLPPGPGTGCRGPWQQMLRATLPFDVCDFD